MRPLVSCAALALLAAVAPARAADAPPKLNVLFLAVDDLNPSAGCYGHPLAKTPNLDRLAKRGVRFDRAYCNYPLCNPSRTSFLSGRRPESTGVWDNTTHHRTAMPGAVYLPEYFRRSGYATARVGKIFHGSMEDPASWGVSEDKPRHPMEVALVRKDPALLEKYFPGAKRLPTWGAIPAADGDETTQDGKAALRAVELLRGLAGKEEPFFLAVGFAKPHAPWVAPAKHFEPYPADKVKLPAAAEPAEHVKDIPAAARTRPAWMDRLADGEEAAMVRAYLACVTHMDAQLGRVLDEMDRLKLWDTTVVVFLGDHGYHLGEHGGMWHKMSLFEESLRVPLVIAAPGAKAGARCGGLVELVDLFPTLVDRCRLKVPGGLEGASLVPLLADPTRPGKEAAYALVERDKVVGRSVRTDRYHYIEWDGGKAGAQLYDGTADPREYRNLAAAEDQAKVVEGMRRLFAKVPVRGRAKSE